MPVLYRFQSSPLLKISCFDTQIKRIMISFFWTLKWEKWMVYPWHESCVIQIIFITGYADYISDGYEVDALHYLIKPVKEEKLFQVLDKAAKKLVSKEKVLNLMSGGEMVRIPVYQIHYVEVNGNYVTIHGVQKVTLKLTLSDLEKMLDSRFFRAGRSVLVNLTKIRKVTKKEIYLMDGSVIPLPRGAYESVNRAIINMIN